MFHNAGSKSLLLLVSSLLVVLGGEAGVAEKLGVHALGGHVPLLLLAVQARVLVGCERSRYETIHPTSRGRTTHQTKERFEYVSSSPKQRLLPSRPKALTLHRGVAHGVVLLLGHLCGMH